MAAQAAGKDYQQGVNSKTTDAHPFQLQHPQEMDQVLYLKTTDTNLYNGGGVNSH